MAELSKAELRRLKRGGYYLVKGDSTHPKPVVPSPDPSPSPQPTEADREVVRRFLKARRADG